MPVTQNHWRSPGRRQVAAEGRLDGDGEQAERGRLWERRVDVPLGRTALSAHVLTVPEEQKARVVHSNGDSQWWCPVSLRVQSQLRSGPPLPPGILSCSGTRRNGEPLTHDSPTHSLGRLSSGSQRAVPTPAAATLVGARE